MLVHFCSTISIKFNPLLYCGKQITVLLLLYIDCHATQCPFLLRCLSVAICSSNLRKSFFNPQQNAHTYTTMSIKQCFIVAKPFCAASMVFVQQTNATRLQQNLFMNLRTESYYCNSIVLCFCCCFHMHTIQLWNP